MHIVWEERKGEMGKAEWEKTQLLSRKETYKTVHSLRKWEIV